MSNLTEGIALGLIIGLVVSCIVVVGYDLNGPTYTGIVVSEQSYQGDHGETFYNLTMSIGAQYPLITNFTVTCSYYHVGSVMPLQRYLWNISHSWSPQFYYSNNADPKPAGC